MIKRIAPRNTLLKGLKSQASSVAFLLSCSVFVGSLFSTSVWADDAAKKKSPPTAEDSLSNAADSLNAVIGTAKRSGMLKSRDTGSVSSEISDFKIDEKPIIHTEAPKNCAAVSILDFSSLKTLSKYEDISTAKAQGEKDKSIEAPLHLARVYISLGLGVEALTAISNETSEQANLLRQVAKILSEPNTALKTNIFAPYSGCGQVVFPWAALDNPLILADKVEGERRRIIIAALDKYPPKLKDFLAVHIGIRALENGRYNIGNGIWSKLEREAREYGSLLPEERYDEDELLYFKALLDIETNSEHALSILSHLAEREGLYRLAALQNLTTLKLKEGQSAADKNSDAIEVDLLEMSEKGIGSTDGQIAAFELVKNRIHSKNAAAAIEVTKKYFNPNDAQYKISAEKIRTLIQARLLSEDKLVRLQGLNGYLSERDFYAITDNLPALEYDALYAAFESGLPELHASIISEDLPRPEKTEQLIKSSKLFEGLKKGQVTPEEIGSQMKLLSEPMIARITQYAISENNIDLMKVVEANTKSKDEAKFISRSIAFAENRWDDIAVADGSTEDDSRVRTATLLTREIQTPVTTKNKNWLLTLPEQLEKIETSIKQTEEFLNNG